MYLCIACLINHICMYKEWISVCPGTWVGIQDGVCWAIAKLQRRTLWWKFTVLLYEASWSQLKRAPHLKATALDYLWRHYSHAEGLCASCIKQLLMANLVYDNGTKVAHKGQNDSAHSQLPVFKAPNQPCNPSEIDRSFLGISKVEQQASPSNVTIPS